MPKATDAFRNIGEVSAELGVHKHVLRFWEAKFLQLKPMKRGGGRRYYRPADVQLLRGIRHLLQTAGYTIKGVQRILREQGTDEVKKFGLPQATGRDDKSRAAIAVPQVKTAARAREFTSAEMTMLRQIATELEAARALLAGTKKSASAAPERGKRSARA